MVEDIFISETKQTEYDEVGDFRTVRDVDAIAQAVTIAIIETVDLAAPSFDPEPIEEQRGRIQSVVQNHPWTREPVTVSVASKDTENNSITYRVTTRRLSLPVETI
jgi:hypothetical protein